MMTCQNKCASEKNSEQEALRCFCFRPIINRNKYYYSMRILLVISTLIIHCCIHSVLSLNSNMISNTVSRRSIKALQMQNPLQSLFQAISFSTSPQTNNKFDGIKSVAITGASGVVGTEVIRVLEQKGLTVYRLTRSTPTRDTDIFWDPSKSTIESTGMLENIDAVINLAGENVGSGDGPLAFLGRWSVAKKEKVMSSRVLGTKLLVDTFSKMQKKPKLFISASAVGYYGYTDSTSIFDESSPKGTGFLAQVCDDWETEALKAESLGIQTVCMRFGVVLTPKGGVVAKLLPLFTFALGGNLGSGKQGFSWVTLQDAAGAISHLLESGAGSRPGAGALRGPVNVCAPNPTTNQEFTKAFAGAFNRPAIFPLPEPIAKIIFGEMGEELLLGGQKAVPSKLLKSGFKFESEDIFTAMKNVLK